MGTSKSLISVALSLIVLTVASVASNVDVDVLPTPQNSNSIHSIIKSQKRYVLFNSRRLEGDCLPICIVNKEGTFAPTDAPVSSTDAPVADPTDDCGCFVDNADAESFKCGNDVYVCEGVTQICGNQPSNSNNAKYYEIDATQCAAMKKVALNTKCVPLPQYGISADDTKDLSNRVCYDGSPFGTKRDGEGCGSCTYFRTPSFETQSPGYDPTDAPDSPTGSPTVSPTVSPTDAPISGPDSDCDCDHDDSRIGSFKCGTNIYVCPGFEESGICSNQAKPNKFDFYPLDADQCSEMRKKKITEKCILLPEYGITTTQGLGLSNRVCYSPNLSKPIKTEEGLCGGECNGYSTNYEFEEKVRRRWLF